MSILHIFIPESGLGASCEWALREGDTLSTGTSACASLPHANQVVLIVAASRILLTQVSLPTLNQAKLRDVLAYAVEDKLLADPDLIHVVAARATGAATPVAVIDKAWLRQQLAQLQQYGIQPDKLLAETLLPRLESQAWTMVWNGQGGFVRTGPSAGFVVDGGIAQSVPMALMLALDEARAANQRPESILLYHTPNASMPIWVEVLDIHTEVRGAWAWQTAEINGAAALNLLQGEFAPARKPRAWLQLLRPALLLAGLILVVHLIATLAHWAQLRNEKNHLQDEMIATFKQTFPEATAIVDPALQMQRNLSGLRRARGVQDSADFLPLLAAAAPVMRQGRIQSLQYAQDKLQFDLLLQDGAQLETLRAELAALPLRADFGAPNSVPEGINILLTLGAGLAPQPQ
jgi:general secretion pathway protein L